MPLMTYQEVAKETGYSVKHLQVAASFETPKEKRLKKIKTGHRTVKFHPSDVQSWQNRNAQ